MTQDNHSGSEQRECSCGGNNPNCFHCGGWGLLGDTIAAHRGDLNELAPSPPKTLAIPIWTTRPPPIPPRIATIRPPPPPKPPARPTVYVNPTDYHAARAKAIASWGAAKNAKQNESQNARTTQVRASTPPLNPEQNLVPCPICGIMCRRIRRHMQRVHNSRNYTMVREPTPQRRGSNRAVFIRADTDRNTANEVIRQTPSHETSFGDKNLGYVARDEGKYGSIPLYDNYSEESTPD